MNIEDLKKKASGFFSQVKSKLSKRGSHDEEDEYDEEDEVTGEYEEVTGEHNMDASLSMLDEETETELEDDNRNQVGTRTISDDGEEYEDDEEYEEEDEQSEEALKRQKIIRYVIGAAIFFLALEFLFPGDETPKQKSKQAKSQKNRRKKKKSKSKVAAKKSVVKESPNKNIDNDKTSAKSISKPVIKPEVVIEEPVEKPVAEPIILPTETTDMNSLIDDPNAQMKDLSEVDDTQQIIHDQMPDKIKEIEIPSDLTKILSETKKQAEPDSQYIAPPDYTKFGRGLVYNCKNKHWACLDRKRWSQCKSNVSYTDTYGKAKECHPTEVYATLKDCRIMQIHKINTNAETNFCD